MGCLGCLRLLVLDVNQIACAKVIPCFPCELVDQTSIGGLVLLLGQVGVPVSEEVDLLYVCRVQQ